MTPSLSALDFDEGKERFELLECQHCGVVRTEPLLSGDELAEYYHASYYGGGEKKFSRLAEWIVHTASRLRAGNLLKYWMKMNPASGTSPVVLDIGCGRGNLLRELSRLGCSCHGVERSDFPLNEHLQGVQFHKQDLVSIDFSDNSFDIVIIWHVLEHLNDPAQTIRTIERILRPGGLFVIAVPNFGSLQARVFKRHWFHLDLPRHTYHFSLETLAPHLQAHHFSVRDVSTHSLEQNLFGFIQSLLNMLIPFARPNTFYRLLKGGGNIFSLAKLAAWLLVAMFIMPLAMAEYVASRIFNNGASLILFAKKIE
ncbi:MAG: class I SAM-dependent methyltransferase [Mariprofundaceae bacterium]